MRTLSLPHSVSFRWFIGDATSSAFLRKEIAIFGDVVNIA